MAPTMDLRFDDHGTKEMLGVVGSNVFQVLNFVQQHPTGCATGTPNNVGSIWPIASVCTGLYTKKCLVTNLLSVCVKMASFFCFFFFVFDFTGI